MGSDDYLMFVGALAESDHQSPPGFTLIVIYTLK